MHEKNGTISALEMSPSIVPRLSWVPTDIEMARMSPSWVLRDVETRARTVFILWIVCWNDKVNGQHRPGSNNGILSSWN